MTILNRKIGEKLIIDKEIVITILGIHENNVRLGINEPGSISIQDKEIHLSMKQGGKSSDNTKKLDYPMHKRFVENHISKGLYNDISTDKLP